MNSKQCKEFTKLWVDMVQKAGPKNWSTYTWYEVGNDLGAGASAMIFDADILGFFQQGGDNKEAGNLGYQAFAANPDKKAPTPNVWIWSLAINDASKQKTPAWCFMQWASSIEHDLFGARKMDFVNPVRASVWNDQDFRRASIDKSYAGYLEQYEASAPGAKIYFTAAAAVLRPDDRLGRSAAEDGTPRKYRSTKGSTSSPQTSMAQLKDAGLGPVTAHSGGARRRPLPLRIRAASSTSGRSHDDMPDPSPSGTGRACPELLPYLLSLPALLVCVGILDAVRERRLLFAAALQSRLPDDAEVHLVRQLHHPCSATPSSGTPFACRCSTPL